MEYRRTCKLLQFCPSFSSREADAALPQREDTRKRNTPAETANASTTEPTGHIQRTQSSYLGCTC